MSNIAFDNLVKAQEIQSAKTMIANMEAAEDLTEYVDHDYPPDRRCQYPDIARRHQRNMNLVFRIRAALKGKEEC